MPCTEKTFQMSECIILIYFVALNIHALCYRLKIALNQKYIKYLLIVLAQLCWHYIRSSLIIDISTSMKTIIVIALIIYSVVGLYFGISNKPFCFDIEEQPGKTIKFFYEVTGEVPQKTQVTIVSSTNNAPIVLIGASNKTEQSSDVPLNVCFLSTDGAAKSVSVDFYTHDKAHLLQLAKKSQIYELHSLLIDVGEGLKEITKNQLFEEQRQIIQSEIITGHQNKVKNFAIIKLIAIVVVAGGQLFLLKKMLEKQGQGYQPV